MWWTRERHRSWKGLAAGAIGGAVASFAMNQFQSRVSRLLEHPDQHPRKKERARQAQGWKEHREPRGNEEENATVKAAVAVAENVFESELPEEAKQPAGNAMHYAFGVATGGLYGVAAEHWPAVSACEGTAFGAALWLAADEVAVPMMKLSKPPQAYPLRVHAMALGSHLIYGAVTELVRRVLRQR
jgi:hypothetical protein